MESFYWSHIYKVEIFKLLTWFSSREGKQGCKRVPLTFKGSSKVPRKSTKDHGGKKVPHFKKKMWFYGFTSTVALICTTWHIIEDKLWRGIAEDRLYFIMQPLNDFRNDYIHPFVKSFGDNDFVLVMFYWVFIIYE